MSSELIPLTFKPIDLYDLSTSSYSFFRKSPLLIKKQYKFSPIALLNNNAATLESTPPDKPNNTFSLPTLAFISLTDFIIKESIVQVFEHLHISDKKLLIILIPSTE